MHLYMYILYKQSSLKAAFSPKTFIVAICVYAQKFLNLCEQGLEEAGFMMTAF